MPGMKSLPLPKVLELLDTLPVKYACLAAIGVTTGCRISELLKLQRHDLLNRDGKIKEEINFIKLKGHSDKVLHRKLSIPSAYHRFVVDHLRVEEQRGYDMPSDYVFRGKLGQPLTRKAAYNYFRNVLGSGHGTHWMRKTFAQEIFKFFLEENTRDPMRALELTRQSLSHARIDTTVRYLGIHENSLQKAQNKIFDPAEIRARGNNGQRDSN